MKLQGIRIAFHTLGCKVNAYETEVMEQAVGRCGAVVTSFDGQADVYVVNTCSVTNMADRKSRQMLHRAKKENPEAVIVACGCYAETGEETALYETGADLIVGNNEKSRLPEILSRYLETRELNRKPDISKERSFDNACLTTVREHTRAYMKVQDGCNQFCSYCIIPYARGRVRSRAIGDVLTEARMLAEDGVKELVLTGIHVSSYGTDLPAANGQLIDLIEAVAAVDGVERIRLGSLEPRIITEDFAKRLAAIPKICPHFHLSLQSGSASTLKRMNRHYLPEEYLEKCGILRRYFDDPALTTDVIAGFPGETDAEFEESLAFTEKVGFYEMHVFKYSRRHGTAADRMPDQVPEDVKTARSSRLLTLTDRMSEAFRNRYVGREVEVLTEELSEIGGRRFMTGYTKEYIRVALPADTPENTVARGVLSEISDGIGYLR